MNRMGAAAGILPGVRIACGTCAECIGNNIWPSPYSLLACQRRLNIIMCPALSTAKRAPNSHAPLFGIHVIRDNAHHMHMELCAPPGLHGNGQTRSNCMLCTPWPFIHGDARQLDTCRARSQSPLPHVHFHARAFRLNIPRV